MRKTTKAKASRVQASGRFETQSVVIDHEQRCPVAEESAAIKVLEMLETCQRPVTREEAIRHLEDDIESEIWSNYDYGLEDIDLRAAIAIRRYKAAIAFIRGK